MLLPVPVTHKEDTNHCNRMPGRAPVVPTAFLINHQSIVLSNHLSTLRLASGAATTTTTTRHRCQADTADAKEPDLRFAPPCVTIAEKQQRETLFPMLSIATKPNKTTKPARKLQTQTKPASNQTSINQGNNQRNNQRSNQRINQRSKQSNTQAAKQPVTQ